MTTKVSNVWTLQDAKNRFSELVRNAIDVGPQTVTRRGEPAVVIVAAADYNRDNQPALSLWEAIRPSGFVGADLNIERDRSEIRHVNLSES
jgi:prevent-host-death family protein